MAKQLVVYYSRKGENHMPGGIQVLEKGNTEFAEDKSLYQGFRLYAQGKGLHIRIGRWNIVGNPVVFLVDFSDLFHQKKRQ